MVASQSVHKDYTGLQDMDKDKQYRQDMATVLQVVPGAYSSAEEPHW